MEAFTLLNTFQLFLFRKEGIKREIIHIFIQIEVASGTADVSSVAIISLNVTSGLQNKIME